MWKRWKIWRWRNRLKLDKHLAVFAKITQPINGFQLSKQARQQGDAMEYVYGEIDFVSFIALISLTSPNQHTVFYDLGSGTGKPALACAMVFEVKKCVGIELFQTLHQAALTQQQQLLRTPNYRIAAKRIEFVHANFLDIPLEEATLIFINATGYFGETWQALNQRLDDLLFAITVITTSKRLITSKFRLIKETKVQMSWGVVSAYIYVNF